MKLKTLTDICGEVPYLSDDNAINREIKKAAQEWIDYIDNWDRNGRAYTELKGFDRLIDSHYYHKEILIDWIEHFFNLKVA